MRDDVFFISSNFGDKASIEVVSFKRRSMTRKQ